MTDRAHFILFRVCMGLYLFVHFLGLLPYAAELFSAQGVLRDPGLNAAPGFFGPLADLLASPFAANTLVAALAGLSLAFAAGFWRRGVALALWAGWAYLLARNNGILNPGIPYIGLVLLLCALVPTGEGRALGAKRAETWAMPREIMFVAWLALAAGYTFSGYTKLISPNWLNGNAMHLMLDNPLAHGQGVIAMLPTWVFALATWGTIALELAALPMAAHKRTRKWIWLALTAMHVGVLLTIGFADLTFGMLVTHLFVANPKWLQKFSFRFRSFAHDQLPRAAVVGQGMKRACEQHGHSPCLEPAMAEGTRAGVRVRVLPTSTSVENPKVSVEDTSGVHALSAPAISPTASSRN